MYNGERREQEQRSHSSGLPASDLTSIQAVHALVQAPGVGLRGSLEVERGCLAIVSQVDRLPLTPLPVCSLISSYAQDASLLTVYTESHMSTQTL